MTEEEQKRRKSNGQFKKGCIPINKGKKMSEEHKRKLLPTLFQKGNIPWHTRPLGSERVDKDGYIEIKVTDIPYGQRKNWKLKHLAIYEKAHNCKVNTKKDCVIFLDGNKRNFDISNLCLISRAENRVLNSRIKLWDRHSGNSEIGMTGVLTARILMEIRRKKNGKTGNRSVQKEVER